MDYKQIDAWRKEGVRFIYVRRFKNGQEIDLIDIPLSGLEMTMKLHPDWVVLGPAGQAENTPTPNVMADSVAIDVSNLVVIACPLCDKSFKTEKGLALHKRRIHE